MLARGDAACDGRCGRENADAMGERAAVIIKASARAEVGGDAASPTGTTLGVRGCALDKERGSVWLKGRAQKGSHRHNQTHHATRTQHSQQQTFQQPPTNQAPSNHNSQHPRASTNAKPTHNNRQGSNGDTLCKH